MRGWVTLIDKHYAGDESGVQVFAAGVLAAYDGMSVEDFEARSNEFLRGAQHPTLGRGYLQCAYTPMVELLQLPARRTGSPTTSPQVADATSCDRSARRCTASPGSA